jgi:hypothetical protein
LSTPRQYDLHRQQLAELSGVAEHVIAEPVGDLPGGGFLYQVIPAEMDANAAAAVFVRGRYGDDRINELLKEGDKDGSAFRSLVGPAAIDTLPERTIRFLATMPDLCDRYAESADLSFSALLRAHWPGAELIYERLVKDKLPR